MSSTSQDRTTTNVLFVCLGNICRSPTAQGVFQKLVDDAGLGQVILTDSCGTAAFNVGKAPDSRAQMAARSRGLEIGHYVARQICDEDYHWSDYVIAMDRSNFTNVKTFAPRDFKGEIAMFMQYSPNPGLGIIPDPYYDEAERFHGVFDMIEAAARGLLQHIAQQRGLSL